MGGGWGWGGPHHCEVLDHSAVYSGFMELVFILWQPNVI